MFNGECWITFDILCGDLQNYQSPIEKWSENVRPFAILTGWLTEVLTGLKLHPWVLLESSQSSNPTGLAELTGSLVDRALECFRYGFLLILGRLSTSSGVRKGFVRPS